MAKRLSVTPAAIVIAVAFCLSYRWYDRFPWLEASVCAAHRERGSTNCGHLTNSGYEPHPNPEVVIRCIVSAQQQRRPFFVTVSISGNDEQFNSAIIGDSKGQAIEIFYARGMVERPNTLLKRRCDVSGEFLVESENVNDISQPHCRPWPPISFKRDHILW